MTLQGVKQETTSDMHFHPPQDRWTKSPADAAPVRHLCVSTCVATVSMGREGGKKHKGFIHLTVHETNKGKKGDLDLEKRNTKL